MSRDSKLYISEILDNMHKAMHAISGLHFEEFISNWEKVYAVVRCLEIIGEASKNIPQDLRDSYTMIPWRTMAGMRDKMIHVYFGIDYETVWKTATENIPALEPLILSIYDTLSHKDKQ